MNKFIFSTDLHHYGNHPTTFVDKKTLLAQGHDPKYILTGDIVDRTGCKKKDVEEATKFMNDLIAVYGDRYVLGNHEGVSFTQSKNYYKIPGTKVLCTHYDEIMWGYSKAEAFRTQELGATTLFRWGARAYNSIFRANGYGIKYWDDEDYVRAKEKCKEYGCTTIIGGHAHPLKTNVVRYDDIAIITLARGQWEIDFDHLLPWQSFVKQIA